MPNDGTHSSADLVHLDGNNENCSVDNLSWDYEGIASKQYFENTGIQKPAEYFHFYPLVEFPDSQYEINKMGQIRNKITRRIVNGALADGYRVHTLRIGKKAVFRSAHILVAKQFIPNPENKPYVNHIDEDRANPCIDNLEWVTNSENVRHGTALDRANRGRNKPINEYNLNGRYIRTWKSIKHLADFFDALYPSRPTQSHISILKYFLGKNKENNKKIVFADRVFVYYNGSCDDLEYFTIKKPQAKWCKEYSLNGINVPNQYLVENVKDTVDCLSVLQTMTSTFTLTKQQKQAIKYAIECIKKIKENETTLNKIETIIHDYKSLKL